MGRYSNNTSRSTDRGGDYSERKKSYSGKSKNYNNSNKDTEFVSLGSMSVLKSKSKDNDYLELTEALVDSETTYGLKVYLHGGAKDITLRTGDTILIKFKDYDKAKPYNVGKAFLMLSDD